MVSPGVAVFYRLYGVPMADTERLPIYVVVENVRSLFNVGAIFRTADGVCVTRIYLTGFTGCPPRKEIRRVALGAEDVVSWTYCCSSLEAIEDLHRQGVQVVALEQAETSVDFRRFPYRLPVGFVVGHEVDGVRPETMEACDGIVQIPMLGHKVSLNVSVASGVMCYELLRVAQNLGAEYDGGGSDTDAH